MVRGTGRCNRRIRRMQLVQRWDAWLVDDREMVAQIGQTRPTLFLASLCLSPPIHRASIYASISTADVCISPSLHARYLISPEPFGFPPCLSRCEDSVPQRRCEKNFVINSAKRKRRAKSRKKRQRIGHVSTLCNLTSSSVKSYWLWVVNLVLLLQRKLVWVYVTLCICKSRLRKKVLRIIFEIHCSISWDKW